ncbi:MAG: hypothetical protein KC657_39945 [Myxococcales bacterium]|nr:hypothetical protein [Myxococcales bacterium]
MIARRARCVVLLAFATVAGACGIKNEATVCGSETKNAGADCTSTYKLCAGQIYDLECVKTAGGFACTCIEDGKRAKTFDSPDVCSVTPDTVRARAKENCGWKLD